MSKLSQCDSCTKNEGSPRECIHYEPFNDDDCKYYQPYSMDTGLPGSNPKGRKIRGWLTWFLIIIPIGAILTVAFSFTTSLEDLYDPELGYDVAFLLYMVDKIIAIGLFALAIYTVISFYTFKPNAVALGKTYVVIVFITNILALLSGEYETSGIGSLTQLFRATIWGIIWFTFLCVSEQVNRLFPKRERHFLKRDKWMLCIFVGSILLCIIAVFISAFAYGMEMNAE